MTELIPGVEYLYTIPAGKPIGYWVLIVVFLVSFAIFWFLTYLNLEFDGIVALIMTATAAALVTASAFVAIKDCNNDNLAPERYAVTISDSVGMREFVERYNIVEQNGNVFVIERTEKHDMQSNCSD